MGQQVRRAAVREASAGSDRWCAPAFLPVQDPTPRVWPYLRSLQTTQLNVHFAEPLVSSLVGWLVGVGPARPRSGLGAGAQTLQELLDACLPTSASHC